MMQFENKNNHLNHFVYLEQVLKHTIYYAYNKNISFPKRYYTIYIGIFFINDKVSF